MTSPDTSIARLDWAGIAAQLDQEGYVVLPGLLGEDAARSLARQTQTMSAAQRVPLASSDLGRGELFYFGADLPAPLEDWRTTFYRHLAVIANRWSEILGIGSRYPTELEDFLRRNKQAGQVQPQSHLSRLGVEDHVALHQRNDDEQVFPLQVIALLSEPGTDFMGGEFVMTEQRPRMQSRPMVLPLKLGDAAIITTSERPFKGTKGHYRVNLKHAISRVRRGQRIGMELTFHDAR
ncbi:2OG-Fe(II) oxygenase [Caballeronia ptereochthonis]|uniref:2OG-Fe(II) oxygenase n=1 Tax=Caballeronia ptereochthonis TaxID=1777144 RepID=UPI000B357CE1|nr:2OG-Fe(II) oxygenase [Caballeronia ptereochthonis]